MMKTFLEEVKNNDTARGIVKVAFERLTFARTEKEYGYAEGLAGSVALIDGSPFDTTSEAISFLWWLYENRDMAKRLY